MSEHAKAPEEHAPDPRQRFLDLVARGYERAGALDSAGVCDAWLEAWPLFLTLWSTTSQNPLAVRTFSRRQVEKCLEFSSPGSEECRRQLVALFGGPVAVALRDFADETMGAKNA